MDFPGSNQAFGEMLCDLEKIGVASLGHRRLLLRAIGDLKIADKGTTATDTPASTPPASAKVDAAERRHITVMFCDLVGSTALSARMDPEDLREVISAYQKCAAQVVQRFGGFVAKYMGDVLVYFGYPQAHEDDAQRAVRAGLELIQTVGGLKSTAPTANPCGHCHRFGHSRRSDRYRGEAQERGIVGETPNLAARLRGLSEPQSVVIAESTRKLLGNLFALEDLGGRDRKGVEAGWLKRCAYCPRPSFSTQSATCCIEAAPRIIGLHPPASARLPDLQQSAAPSSPLSILAADRRPGSSSK